MKLTPTLLLLCALAGTGVSAQTPEWSMGGRFAFGATLAGKEPQNADATIGGGFWIERKVTDTSSVFCEVNYQYFLAQLHEVTKFGWGYYPNSASSTGVSAGYLTPVRSVDTRKNQLDGYGLMVGYRRHITPKFSTHYGAGYSIWISQQEVVGQLHVHTSPTDINSGSFIEGLAYAPAKRSIRPIAYSGVKYQLSANIAVESNIRYFTWIQADYRPFAYSGVEAYTDGVTRSKVTFDISLSLKF